MRRVQMQSGTQHPRLVSLQHAILTIPHAGDRPSDVRPTLHSAIAQHMITGVISGMPTAAARAAVYVHASAGC